MNTGQPTNFASAHAYTHGFTFGYGYDYAHNYIYIRRPTRERTLDVIDAPTCEALT